MYENCVYTAPSIRPYARLRFPKWNLYLFLFLTSPPNIDDEICITLYENDIISVTLSLEVPYDVYEILTRLKVSCCYGNKKEQFKRGKQWLHSLLLRKLLYR